MLFAFSAGFQIFLLCYLACVWYAAPPTSNINTQRGRLSKHPYSASDQNKNVGEFISFVFLPSNELLFSVTVTRSDIHCRTEMKDNTFLFNLIPFSSTNWFWYLHTRRVNTNKCLTKTRIPEVNSPVNENDLWKRTKFVNIIKFQCILYKLMLHSNNLVRSKAFINPFSARRESTTNDVDRHFWGVGYDEFKVMIISFNH